MTVAAQQNMDSVLQGFEPISLSEMDSVSLMDRQDTKFAAPESELLAILSKLKKDYFVLDINDNRISTYSSLYFDTVDNDNYVQHHKGRSNRYKLRYRSYVESGISFFEVKFKSNKGRTIKKRIKKSKINLQLDSEDIEHLNNCSNLDPALLTASIWIDFRRITLVSKDFKERVTIDVDLTYKNISDDKNINCPGLIIIEVKQPKFTRNSVVISVLHEFKIFPMRISKYCLGIISCFKNEVKYNNFKKKILKLAKITSNDHYRDLVTT